MSSDPPRRRDPSEYRPDLRPMLILAGLLAVIVLGWVLLGPRILPPVAPPDSAATGLDGRWTITPDDPLATTLALSGATYALEGATPFAGSGRATRDGDDLVLADDPACADAVGRYAVALGDMDRVGLLLQHRAQTMMLEVISDTCEARADALGGEIWVLRASGRDGVYGICDPPNEEAAITGHWPEPSGCAG